MIREIVKDTEFLSKKCITAKPLSKETKSLIQDLLDTAEFHAESGSCVGLAANQIGSNLRVIVAKLNDSFVPFINPVIVDKSTSTRSSEEGCLSLEGTREVTRHTSVCVLFSDMRGKSQRVAFSGFPAIILQHEIDHLNGKLI